MAKKQAEAKQHPAEKKSKKRRNAAAEEKPRKQRRSLEDIREEKGPRKYTLIDCMRFGRIANILFVVFIIICLIYYYSIANKGNYSIPFEVVAYSVEFAAFVLFSTSIIWLERLVRSRKIMKFLMFFYIIAEIILMLLEFQLLPFRAYNGLSVPLTVVHVLFSAGASFSLLCLDSNNKRLQWIVGITTCIVLAGMLPAIAGYRVYASILVNAFAYIFFFTAMEYQLRLEEVDIDCYGDSAKVQNFESTFFADTPTMVEKPVKEKKTLRETAKQIAQDLTSEEQIVLTDKDEKFEYEFGVEEDDDDDDEYEDDYEGDSDGEDDDAE